MPDAMTDNHALINDIIPSEEVDKLEHGRIEEILQPLLDLAYIEKADPILLSDGIRAFRQEYLALDLIPEFTPSFLSLPDTELEGEELNLLHTLTALDGDFVLHELPKDGMVNLCSRIIHYRLSIHRLCPCPIDHPFSKKSFQLSHQLYDWIEPLPEHPLDLINLLGDIPTMIQLVNENTKKRLDRRIVVFKYQKMTSPSPFEPSVPMSLKDEVQEDDQEPEEDNETEMLHLETEIDDQLDVLQEEKIFDTAEQAALQKDTRKNRRKRSRIRKIRAMIDVTLASMNSINESIGQESDTLSTSIQKLQTVQEKIKKQAVVLREQLQEKDQAIHTLQKAKKNLKKKERQLKRKKRKRPTSTIQEEIDRLEAEIQKIKNSDRIIENLSIERSNINIQLLPIEEDLQNIDRRLKSLQNKMDRLIQERAQKIRKKQAPLKQLLDRLKVLEKKVDRIRFSFRGRLKKVLQADFYKNTIQQEVFNRRNRSNVLKIFNDDPYNAYLIQLIQIFQWTNGFYYGDLDQQIGDRTFSALNDMSTYSKGLRLKFILSRLSENDEGTRGYWILNIKYLFQKLSTILREQPKVTTQQLLEKYETEFVEGDTKATKIGNMATDQGYRDIVQENQTDLKKSGVIRRIYYGVKRIATTLYNALNDLIQLLRRGIKKLIYLVKNLIKIVYKEIREGLRKFKDGMIFLFGNRQFATPTTEGSVIFTKFDFDFDATVIGPQRVSHLDYIHHTTKLQRFSKNLDFTMVLTGKILKWVFRLIQVGTPIGWGRLAIKVAIYYKHLILKWLADLGKHLIKAFVSIKYKVKEVKGG